MKKLVSLLLLCLLAFTSARAFDATRARELLDILASDAFEGRRPGHAGGIKTEEFLAKNLAMIGVEHGGTNGYFQDVPMLVTEELGGELTLMDSEHGKIPFTLGVDFTVVTNSGTGGVVAPVVIVGYGYVRPDKDRDDYGDANVSGKIVLIVRGTPKSPYDFEQDYPRSRTLAWAKERGAAAVLFYQDAFPTYGAAIPKESYDPDLPILYVGDRALSLLLNNTGYSIKTYKDAIAGAPLPLETKKRMWVNARVKKLSGRTPRNVLGIVYGTDPVLKNEIVALGAHWDHIGKNANGVIYNGADDNASGTALIAEIGRSLAQQPLKRSVLIAHFTGEEDGLIGSTYFTRNPSIPFANIVGMVNLDCEGMGMGRPVMAGGETFGDAWDEYVAGLDSIERSQIVFSREDGAGASDHDPFMRAGCPVTAFWSRGEHPFYHRPDDDSQWISDSVLAIIGARAEHFVRFLGDRAGPMAFRSDSLRLLARFAVTIDFAGFTVYGDDRFPQISSVSAAWLPREAAVTTAELARRISDLRYDCDARDVESAGLAQSVSADRRHRSGIFFGMDARDLSYRTSADVRSLAREGLSVVRLGAAKDGADEFAHSAGINEAKKLGLFALMPFDYGVAPRIAAWGKKSIVNATLDEFSAAPESVREGLLTSDALFVLEIDNTPSADALRAIYSGRARQVHLSFGTLPKHRREEHARTVIRLLYEAGYSREEILLLTAGNLRRFLST